MMVHIAGASQLNLNRRWATPTGLGQYDATLFPFADRAQKDAASGVTDGLLDNDRARANLPKNVYTNTGVDTGAADAPRRCSTPRPTAPPI